MSTTLCSPVNTESPQKITPVLQQSSVTVFLTRISEGFRIASSYHTSHCFGKPLGQQPPVQREVGETLPVPAVLRSVLLRSFNSTTPLDY